MTDLQAPCVARVNVVVETWDVSTPALEAAARAGRGRLVRRERRHNLVTTAGLNLLRDRLSGSGDALSHFAVGMGSTPVALGDTALDTEVFRDTFTQTVPGSTQLVYRYYLGPSSANGNTLAEAGLLNAAAAGDLYARIVLGSTIVKTSAIAVTFGWTLSWSN